MHTDVVIIGGGHAGCEAALASARVGADTVMVVMNPDKIGHVSCNPAIGGVAKGQLVREIDALGGMMGLAADENAVQFRILNSSKGPAVRSPRAQIDRWSYQAWVKRYLEKVPNIRIRQDQAVRIITENAKVVGVETFFGEFISCRAVVICSGTFSKARLHLGMTTWDGGRHGEPSAPYLSDSLRELGLELFRLRTDTCPRIDSRTIDFSKLRREQGDEKPQPFSFLTEKVTDNQLPCYVGWTNESTFKVVEAILDQAPAITGAIEGLPPRYCPNIETKVARFPEKRVHHLFIEPEGRDSFETYLNGFSTSIPPKAQEEMINSVIGLEDARVVRYGYAVEYDAVRPTQLKSTLETKPVGGLFTAGQINGTSGYEEAAAQGLITGANAALSALGRPEFTLGRHEAYMGVLVDDLTTRGTEEPYRLFTSRAEFRLLTRQDNADLRLTPKAAEIGLTGEDRLSRVEALRAEIASGREVLESTFDQSGTNLVHFLKRPENDWIKATELQPKLLDLSERAAEQLAIEAKYEGYIARSLTQIRALEKSRSLRLPPDFDYSGVDGLSREAKEKLNHFRPENLDQAMRISGVSPADAALLMVKLRK